MKKRKAAERRFRLYGLIAVTAVLGLLALLLGGIIYQSSPAFVASSVRLDIDLAGIDRSAADQVDTQQLVKRALYALFPDLSDSKARRELNILLSSGAGRFLREKILADPSVLGGVHSFDLPAGYKLDQWREGRGVESLSKIQIDAAQLLADQGRIIRHFNTAFFTKVDSRQPEQAGIAGALIGSVWTVMVTMVLALPLGIMAALYLEEFAPRNSVTNGIEVSINNLASVPSIIFGLLGLVLFLGYFGLPRSSPLVAGMVLALMTLPTIIVITRASLKTVPPSIREAALAMGASRWQVVLHHVLPLSMPGIMTGAILGLSRAMGETAPLLMIGMVAFIADFPDGLLSPASLLPVQVYLWADSPERAFAELSAAAILILLLLLLGLNGGAIFLRQKLVKKW